jgi:hypothetical protein
MTIRFAHLAGLWQVHRSSHATTPLFPLKKE